jgi:hypothetical protein
VLFVPIDQMRIVHPRMSNLLLVEYSGIAVQMQYHLGHGGKVRDFLRRLGYPLVWCGVDLRTGARVTASFGAIERKTRKKTIWMTTAVASFIVAALCVLLNETLHVGDWVGVPILGGMAFGIVALLLAAFS